VERGERAPNAHAQALTYTYSTPLPADDSTANMAHGRSATSRDALAAAAALLSSVGVGGAEREGAYEYVFGHARPSAHTSHPLPPHVAHAHMAHASQRYLYGHAPPHPHHHHHLKAHAHPSTHSLLLEHASSHSHSHSHAPAGHHGAHAHAVEYAQHAHAQQYAHHPQHPPPPPPNYAAGAPGEAQASVVSTPSSDICSGISDSDRLLWGVSSEGGGGGGDTPPPVPSSGCAPLTRPCLPAAHATLHATLA